MDARSVRWVVALAWLAGAAWAGENDWDVTLTGDCHEMRPGEDEEEDPIPCPPVCYYGNQHEFACFTMDTAPTIDWDFSEVESYPYVGVVLALSMDVFPHHPALTYQEFGVVYGTSQSPLPAADTLSLPELPACIAYGELHGNFYIYAKSTESAPWMFRTTRQVWFHIYTVLDAPVAPQAVVWMSALAHSTWWMKFESEAEAALKKLVECSWGVDEDDGVTILDEQTIWNYDPSSTEYFGVYKNEQGEFLAEVFWLRDWLDDYGEGQTTGMCATIACHLMVMAATVGIEAGVFMAPQPPGSFAYNGHRRSGHTNDWYVSSTFAFHQAMSFDGGIYDGCVCFQVEDGAYAVPSTCLVDIAIAWSSSAWFEAVWVEPSPEPSSGTPTVDVGWHAP